MKTKLLLKIFSVLFAFTCLSASATTDVWTFDKTTITGDTSIKAANYADYLPDGWYAPSYDYGFRLMLIDGQQYLVSQVTQSYETRFLPFQAHGGSLTFSIRSRFGNDMDAEIYLWKATRDGDSFTVGEPVVSETVSLTGTVQEFTYTLPEDGYYAFSIYSGAAILSVSNSYEPASSMSTDVWTFDKTTITGDTSIKAANYADYLPDGWYAPSYDYGFRLMLIDGQQYLVSQVTQSYETRFLPFQAHGGSLTFSIRSRFGNDMDAEIYLWKATRDGDSFTVGEPVVSETVSLTGTVQEFTYTLPEDGYYAFSIYSGAAILSVTNTYEAAAVTYTVSGSVVDEAGAPVADANVAVGSASAVTDAEGKYTVSGLADGTYDIVVSKSGYDKATASVTVSGADMTVEPITLQIEKWYLGGYVQNSNYARVAGAAMQLYSGEDMVGETTSDEQGNYKFAIPAVENSYTLKIQAEYYKDYTSTVSVRESYLDADKVRVFNPALDAKLVSFNLTVKDTWNQAVNGAEVIIDGENLANVKVYESGNSGVYVLRNKRAGDLKDNEYTWTVTAEGYDTAMGTVVFNGNDVNRTVTLIPTGATVISGTVTDVEGNAISGAHVSLTIGASAVAVATIDTNAEGFYSFARNDLEGTATVEVVKDCYATESKEVSEIVANANNICDFTLTELVYTYTATVKNTAGDLLENATVLFDGNALIGENGVFSTSMKAKDAAGREIPVEITCEGYQAQTYNVTLNRDITETYVLRETAVSMTEVLLEVKNSDMVGVEGANVRIYSDDTEIEVEDWGDGAYFAAIPTDANMGKTFTIEITSADYKDYTSTFVIDGQDVDLEITLENKPGDGIESITGDIDDDAVIFTIDGIRVEVRDAHRLPAGLYIVNGKKCMVR